MGVSPSILVRCDGSREAGLGHVVRCLALADELRDVHGCRIAFAMRNGQLGIDRVRQGGYAVLTPQGPPRSFDYARWMNEAIDTVDARVLILDVRDDLPRSAVDTQRSRGITIVAVDDPGEKRLSADIAFYPPVPQARRLDWTGFTGRVHLGWDWVVLRRGFAAPRPWAPRARPGVLVTMGGSDPEGLTLKAVAALDLVDGEFDAAVVLGGGFDHDALLSDLLAGARRRYRILRNVEDMAGVCSGVDLALASFGVTAYELAALGVPAIHLCLTEDHAESSAMFEEEGVAVTLGLHSSVSPGEIAGAVQGLLSDPAKRDAMARAGRARMDGKGAARIAERILDRWAKGGPR